MKKKENNNFRCFSSRSWLFILIIDCENNVKIDVCILENTFVKGILGTTLPNKDQKLINIKKQLKTMIFWSYQAVLKRWKSKTKQGYYKHKFI